MSSSDPISEELQHGVVEGCAKDDVDVAEEVSIDCIPDEILEYILSLTSPYCDFKSALQVSKRWCSVTKRVIRHYKHQFQKAIAGIGDVELLWQRHQAESGPTVTERYSHSACCYNKSVYVFGGCTSTSTTFNDLWRFDLEWGRWVRPLATGTYPSPKACASLVVYNDSLILFGGWSHPTPYTFHQASKFFNQLNIYSPESNRWTQVVTDNCPDGIAGHGATIVGDLMVVFGGYHGHGNSSNNVWLLNLTQMVWSKQSTSEPKPLPRYSHAQVLVDDSHILMLGGCGGPNMQFSDAWLLDTSGSVWQWTQLTVNNRDLAVQQLWCHPACHVGDKLVVLGKNTRTAREAVTTSTVHSLPTTAAQPAGPQVPTKPPSVQSISVHEDERVAAAGAGSSISQTHTAGPRAGMPSVRPNAMKDRRRQLEALNKYEDKLRAAAHRSSAASASAASLSSVPRRYSAAGMCVHVLDISQAVESGQATWLPIRGINLTDSPDEATFYTLVEGRGELMMFGGIHGDARNLQRGSSTLQPQAVSSDVSFLSFKPKHLL